MAYIVFPAVRLRACPSVNELTIQTPNADVFDFDIDIGIGLKD